MDGRLLDSNRVKQTFWTCTRKASVKRIRIHDMRHSFASQLAMAGVSIYSIQALLGHTDVKTTMRYAHLSPEAQAGVVQVLDGPPPACATVARAWHAGNGLFQTTGLRWGVLMVEAAGVSQGERRSRAGAR